MLNKKKQFQAPRQVLKWIDTLDLSYQIKNFKRDVSNGYIIAEILCQFDKNININSFYNQFNLEKKFHNWNKIREILKKMNFILTNEQIRNIIYMEQNSALDFVIRLYNSKKKKKVQWKAKTINNLPLFAQPTANFLTKKLETNDIPNQKLKKQKLDQLSQNHFQKMKSLKQNLNLQQFMKKRKNEIIENYLKQLKPKKKYKSKIKDDLVHQANTNQTKMISLKKYQNEQTTNTEGINFDFKKKQFILSIGELIQKRFKLTNDQEYIFVAENFDSLLEDPLSFDFGFICAIFDIIKYISKDIVDLIGGSIKYFHYFFLSIIQLFENLPNNLAYFNVLKDCLSSFSQYWQNSNEIVQLYMENTGLFIMRDFCEQNSNKIIFIAQFIHTLFRNDCESKVQMICRIREVFSKNLRQFYHLLARFSNYDIDKMADENYINIMFYYASICLKSDSVFNLTSGLQILKNIFEINPTNIIIDFYNLNPVKLLKLQYWEINALLLIISGKIIIHQTKQESGDQITKYFYNLIQKILKQKQSSNIIKIAINYLVELQSEFPFFQDLYLQILLDQPIEFLQQQFTENVCSNLNTQSRQSFKNFEYIATGAHQRWNSLNFLFSLQRYIDQNNIKIFDEKICYLIEKNATQDMQINLKEQWLLCFDKICNVLINTLTCPQLCDKVSKIIFLFLEQNKDNQRQFKNKFDQLYGVLNKINNIDLDNHCLKVVYNFFVNLSQKKQFFDFCYNLLKKYSQEQFQYFLHGKYGVILNNLTIKQKQNQNLDETIKNSLELLFKNNQINI